ncbi:hypothetical protein FQA39_LY09895 [Lamprigera yunnana]|nr:hypothetical protein FQA39_LY09895 [Lamprigera yunnana]
MTERSDNAKFQCNYQPRSPKMSNNDLGTKRTLIVLVIVVGCFAVLWPKVLYPMIVGSTNQRMKPNNLDKGCCDVISDSDVNTIKIMSELCNTIVQDTNEKPLKGGAIIERCRKEIFDKCGIDISALFAEQVRLGHSFKQILDEVRSLNGSLCLKYQFGISPWTLGAPHRITINLSPIHIRQERPSHLRPELLHPALRERGSAIVQPYQPPTKTTPSKYVEGRPGPVPGVRPPLGAAAHMVHSTKSSNSMSVIMPIYTIGIVIFFSYTLMKLLFKKKAEGAGAPLYPPVEPSITFRKEVFETQKRKISQGGPLRDEELDSLRIRLRETELAMERIVEQMAQVPLRSQKEDNVDEPILVNGSAKHLSQENEQPSVKILGMEMTASCEGGQKWERTQSPVVPKQIEVVEEPEIPAQEIFLEGTLPAQSQLLVADSVIEEEANSISSSTDPPVVLASKMTLSVISLDTAENGKEVPENQNEDIIEESKYTTASEITAADCDISDEDVNDIENVKNDTQYKTNEEEKMAASDDSDENSLNDIEEDIKNDDEEEINKENESVLNDKELDNKELSSKGKLDDTTNENQQNNKEEIGNKNINKEINNKKVSDEETADKNNKHELNDEDETNKENEEREEINNDKELDDDELDSEEEIADAINENEHNNKEEIGDQNINEDEEISDEDNENELNDEEEIGGKNNELEVNEDELEEINNKDEPNNEEASDEEEIEEINNESDDDVEIEEIIIFEDDSDDNFDYEDEEKMNACVSPDTMENIGNIIDEIITDGALRLANENSNYLNTGNLQHSTEDIDYDNQDEAEQENYNNNNGQLSLDQNEISREVPIDRNQVDNSDTINNSEGTTKITAKDDKKPHKI